MANNAWMKDPSWYTQIGLDPKTGLPTKLTEIEYPVNVRDLLGELDKTDFINRGAWYNLPSGITGDLVERIMYYRGQGAFFYMEATDKFYFLPYALDGTIDMYGRYKGIRPVVFNGSTADEKPKEWIPGLHKDVVYALEDIEDEHFFDGAVILNDRNLGISQSLKPRVDVNAPVLDAMSEAFPLARTSLIAHSGVKGIRVNSESDQAQVQAASRAITKAAMTGNPWVPIVSNVEYQDLTDSGAMRTEEYLSYFQSLDNLRLKGLGIECGGVFEKKSQMLQDEMSMNATMGSRVMDDAIKQRQDFCLLINAIWGLSVWYEPSEQSMGGDMDGDGSVTEDNSESYATQQEGGEE